LPQKEEYTIKAAETNTRRLYFPPPTPFLPFFLLLEILLHNAMDCSEAKISQKLYFIEFDHKNCDSEKCLFNIFQLGR